MPGQVPKRSLTPRDDQITPLRLKIKAATAYTDKKEKLIAAEPERHHIEEIHP